MSPGPHLYAVPAGGTKVTPCRAGQGFAQKEKASSEKYTFPNWPFVCLVRKNYNIKSSFAQPKFTSIFLSIKVYFSELRPKTHFFVRRNTYAR